MVPTRGLSVLDVRFGNLRLGWHSPVREVVQDGVNGFLVDARILKREFQEEALRMRLIPFIPEKPKRLKEDDDEKE